MIVRAILEDVIQDEPVLLNNFDWFNDYQDTAGWLRAEVERTGSSQAYLALEALEKGHQAYLEKFMDKMQGELDRLKEHCEVKSPPEVGEIHFDQALKMSDEAGELFKSVGLARAVQVLENTYGRGSALLALRAVVGRYHRFAGRADGLLESVCWMRRIFGRIILGIYCSRWRVYWRGCVRHRANVRISALDFLEVWVMAAQKPVFNVPPSFQGVVTVAMNLPMARLVSTAIHELDGGETEEELVAFGRRLHNVTRRDREDE